MIYHLYHTLRYFGNQTFGLCFQRHDLYFPGNFTQPDFLFRINALGKGDCYRIFRHFRYIFNRLITGLLSSA